MLKINAANYLLHPKENRILEPRCTNRKLQGMAEYLPKCIRGKGEPD